MTTVRAVFRNVRREGFVSKGLEGVNDAFRDVYWCYMTTCFPCES